MNSFGKRGQGAPSGSNASILVIVIAAFIILYILFLPKGERDKILTTDASTAAKLVAGKLPGSTLINENPGTLTVLKSKEFDHSLPSFNLFTKKEDAVLKSIDSVNVGASRSGTRKRSFILVVTDKVENAKLSFTVNSHKGNLIITQNGNEVFRGEVDSFTEPLSIELEKENVFEFSTEPVPWYKPFTENSYDLREVKITGTVERLDNKEAVQTVILGTEEANLMDSATLSYFVDCSLKDVGRLDIYLNSNLLASKVPDCGSPEKWQVDPRDLRGGKNEFRFVAGEGTYLLDRLLLRTKLKEPIFPIYFFSLNNTVFRRVENNTINSTLNIMFLDDKERKTATIEINSQKTRVDTRQANFSKNIDSFLVAGSNFLRIVPETTLNIIELKLLLDCRKAEECG
ncbi:hypothetical protein HYU40_00900 [Candidatus Woesearchaeota archaeon]|nr:hypothetical protein [Candidatus Woesearchaeota archaeon]